MNQIRIFSNGINKEKFYNILLPFTLFMSIFFPTSINGNIISISWLIRNIIGSILSFYLMIRNVCKTRQLVVSIFLFSWLLFLTYTAFIFYPLNDLKIAYASISGFLPILMLWCIKINNFYVNSKYAVKILRCISIVLCIWGWGLVLNIDFIRQFTGYFYTQLTETMFESMVIDRGKPVMSFGTHSFAAYFILYFFYCFCIVVKEGGSCGFDYLIMIAFFLMEIPINSNTSMLSMGLMVLLITWATSNNRHKIIIYSGILIAVLIGVFYMHEYIIDYVTNIIFGTHSDSHGIKGRYLSGIYNENFYIMFNYVGVGFLRSTSEVFRMNDSAFIYLLTQGNIPALVASYYLFINFIRNNMIKYQYITLLILFIWEIISASTFVTSKMLFVELFIVCFINSVVAKGNDLHEN